MVRYQRDLDFVGREEIMEEIKQRFSSKNRVAIAGIGGVGYSPGLQDLMLVILIQLQKVTYCHRVLLSAQNKQPNSPRILGARW